MDLDACREGLYPENHRVQGWLELCKIDGRHIDRVKILEELHNEKSDASNSVGLGGNGGRIA